MAREDAWTFVARRGSDSKEVFVSRAKAEEIASSPAGSRQDFLALWLVPPFYRREAQWRARHGGLPLAWEYNLGKRELPEDFLRDPRAWLERVKREERGRPEEVPGTRGWSAANQAGRRVGPTTLSWQGIDRNERVVNRVRNGLVDLSLFGVEGVSPPVPGEEHRLRSREEAEEAIYRGQEALAFLASQAKVPVGHARRWWGSKVAELRRLLDRAQAVASGELAPKMTAEAYRDLRRHLRVGGDLTDPDDWDRRHLG